LNLLSLTEVANRLGICRRTVNRMIEAGTGPTIVHVSERRRFVTEDDYQEFCMSLRRPAREAAAAQVAA
jgi:excisionase family DNA binding protein